MPNPWEKYAAKPASQEGPWVKYAQPAAAPAAKEDQGLLSSFADASGLTGAANAIAHPIDTIAGIPKAVSGMYHQTADNVSQGIADYKGGNTAGAISHAVSAVPILGPALDKATDQAADNGMGKTGSYLKDLGRAVTSPGAMGTIAGTAAGLVGPEAIKAAVPLGGRILAKTGEAAQDSGVGLINKTAGMLKPDFKRGANGGQAYFDAGGGPAMSMGGLADKAASLKSKVGGQISDAYANSNATIPAMDVAAKLQPAIDRATDLATGPGGTGDISGIENYSAQFRPALLKAVQNGGMSPSEVQAMKRAIAENTTWGDPTTPNLKSIRQKNVGALGGLLEDSVPEVAPLNKQFQGLVKFADRTQSRAETGSNPLTHLVGKGIGSTLGASIGGLEGGTHGAIGGAMLGLALDSVPVKSALASGLYYGGRGAESIGDRVAGLPPLNSALVAPATYGLIGKKRKAEGDE